MKKEVEKYIVSKDLTVVQTMQRIDDGRKGIVFVVDSQEKLIGCATDGDIRRWLIKTGDLTAKVSDFMFSSPHYIMTEDKIDCKKFMMEHSINAVPVLNENNQIVKIVFQNDSKAERKEGLKGVPIILMAGGKGTRLYPYTKILPKPLIPIGDVPILERIINRFTEYGADDFYLTVNYKKGMIKSYFDDIAPEYNITYINEEKPLGTGGSISLIEEKFEVPVIVANCDSLIETDLADIYKQHLASGNKITVVSSMKNVTIPYGVLNVKEHGIIESIDEKPSLSYLINTGMYIVNPEMLEMIPKDTFYHMTHLIDDAMKAGLQVGVYPVSEDTFLDMGEFAEMKRMEEKLNL